MDPGMHHYAILVNGETTKHFRTSRGIRQGDPLSPLLFVSAMEGLSSMLAYAEAEGRILGLGKKLCNVNHLLFADDVMIFSKATKHYVYQTEKVLSEFQKASGLKINLSKSKAIFSKRVPLSIRRISSYREGVLPVKYLGIPLHAKRLHVSDYQPLVDKIKKKIGFRGMNTLSQAGRVEMLRSSIIP